MKTLHRALALPGAGLLPAWLASGAFNQKGKMKERITLGEKYGPAMEIQTQAEADAYFNECVEHMMLRKGCNRSEAEAIERSNLGYYAGYYCAETRERVERLFRCSHPVFGPVTSGLPSPAEAVRAGVEAAVRSHHN